ncbi:MAG: hypothetical protein Q4G33_03320 [bacterium]|nr:hypothetical protein [bacterium]
MKKYNRPIIEVLLFDEEEVLTTSTMNMGFDSEKAITKMMGDDAGLNTNSNTSVSITSVKVTNLN